MLNAYLWTYFLLDSEWTNKVILLTQQCFFSFILVHGYLSNTGNLRYVA